MALTQVQLDMLRGLHHEALSNTGAVGDEVQCWAGDVELLAAVRTHLGTLLDDLAAAEGRAGEARTRADRAEAELAAIRQKGA